MLNSNVIGDKIAAGRKKLNFSQSELAQQVSISSQAVGKWERGESVPDIFTLNKLAQIFGVDLNYFSDNSPALEIATPDLPLPQVEVIEEKMQRKKNALNWDMSQGNWLDADFSGLKNLKEKFSSSNMKNCKFRNSDLSELLLASNNIELCDFSSSDLSSSKIQSSNLLGNQFVKCSFVDAEFFKNNIEKCDFTEADFSGTTFSGLNLENSELKDALWKSSTFKNSNLSNVVFGGTLEDCHFELCGFHNVKFEGATLLNTFFKYNKRFKKVQFIDCKVDRLTYAFLKNNEANLAGVTLIDE